MTNQFVQEMINVQVLEMKNHLMVMTNHKTLILHHILELKNHENVHNLDKEELIIENLDNDFLYLNFLMMLH